MKNLLITGRPGCGKTTLIKKILERANLPIGGFYTEEIRERGARKGFRIITTAGKIGVLAHVDFTGEPRVGKYGVNLKDFEKIAVLSMLDGLKKKKPIVVDEIGRMELFSEEFRRVLTRSLDARIVIGTILMKYHEFADRIRERADVEVLLLTPDNEAEILNKVLASLNDKKSTGL
jgi:nucleoside-triphosphatase